MTGLFGSLNTATGGMRAQQGALQTTGHNLANTNTDGYSRQRVSMKTSFPQSIPGIGQMGTGVHISGVTRIADDYITRQLHNELSSLTQYGNKSEVLGQLEAIFNEPSDSSVSAQMGEFFAAWGSLGDDPSLEAGKTHVIKQSETLLDTINHIAKQIAELSVDTIGQIEKEVLDFNSAAKQLKDVNDQIFNATIKGETPNDLMDTQDRLLGQLRINADVEVDKDQYGRATVTLAGKDIVTKKGVHELAVSKEGNVHYGTNEDGTVSGDPITLNRGSIKGFQDVLKDVQKKETELNEFVGKFATTVNTIMKKGAPENEENARDFFIFDEKSPNIAQTISVNEELIEDPTRLITGQSFDKSVVGNGSRAKAIADLQTISLDFSQKIGTDPDDPFKEFKEYIGGNFKDESLSLKGDTKGSPIFNHYNKIITGMGIDKQQADNMVANQSELVSLLDQRRESVSGVDMNEEVVDMIRFQSAFQANARMISTINDMLDTLINRTGV